MKLKIDIEQLFSLLFLYKDKNYIKKKLTSFIERVKNDDFDGANNCFSLQIYRNSKLHRELYVGNAFKDGNKLK